MGLLASFLFFLLLHNSLGWFSNKSENIPVIPDLGNASAGMREKGSGISA